jgi:hypothetical protein
LGFERIAHLAKKGTTSKRKGREENLLALKGPEFYISTEVYRIIFHAEQM